MRAYLDIDIGDAAKYELELAAYNRATAFLQQCGAQYGLSAIIQGLDNEEKQMLREAYANDPNWSGKGGLASAACALRRCLWYTGQYAVSQSKIDVRVRKQCD